MKKKKKVAFIVNSEKNDSSFDSELKNGSEQWTMFIKVVAAHIDPVLASILYATEFLQFDVEQKVVRVATLKKFILFQDLFVEQKKIYQEYLDRIFGFQTMLLVEFTNVAEPKKIEFKIIDSDATHKVQQESPKRVLRKESRSLEKSVDGLLDISDIKKWQVTHALLEHFGGTVREIIKDTDGFDA